MLPPLQSLDLVPKSSTTVVARTQSRAELETGLCHTVTKVLQVYLKRPESALMHTTLESNETK